MLSKYIVPGDRVELTALERGRANKTTEEEKKKYASKVNDVLSDERLEIIMPMEKTKIILLPVDGEYEICFYAKNSVFVCKARVVDRYKADGFYLLLFELISDLRKNQRREFYRFNCIIKMKNRALSEEESERLQSGVYEIDMSVPLNESVIVDISGGGMRFISEEKYEEGTYMYVDYALFNGAMDKNYELIGKVLTAKEIENKRGQFEYRLQYVNISNKEREEIIRYIFEEERKNRIKR